MLFDRDCGICSAVGRWVSRTRCPPPTSGLKPIQSGNELLAEIPEERRLDAFYVVTPAGQVSMGGDAVRPSSKRSRSARVRSCPARIGIADVGRPRRVWVPHPVPRPPRLPPGPFFDVGRVRAFDEGAQRLQVLLVAFVFAGELEASRDFAEAFVVHEKPNAALPSFPFPMSSWRSQREPRSPLESLR